MIIFIVGIDKSDLSVEKALYAQPENKTPHLKVPTSLIGWPESTILKCWNCHESIKGRPFPIPTRKETHYVNKGIACSKECGKTYYLTYKDPDIDQREIPKHIDIFIGACRELGYDITHIIPREHFYKQADYGGC